MARAIPVHWHDTGEWEFYESRNEYPGSEEASVIDIPDELIAEWHRAQEALDRASAGIVGAITDHVDAHAETVLHWNVRNAVQNERNRRQRHNNEG